MRGTLGSEWIWTVGHSHHFNMHLIWPIWIWTLKLVQYVWLIHHDSPLSEVKPMLGHISTPSPHTAHLLVTACSHTHQSHTVAHGTEAVLCCCSPFFSLSSFLPVKEKHQLEPEWNVSKTSEPKPSQILRQSDFSSAVSVFPATCHFH